MKKKQKPRLMTNVGLLKMIRMMRFTVFMMLISLTQVLAVNTYSQQTRLTLDMRNSRVEDVIDQIEKNTKFSFLYNKNIIDVERRVNVIVQEKGLNEVLNQIFENTNVSYAIRDRLILLTNNQTRLTKDAAQQHKLVSGKVIDSSGSPLPGVTVIIKGTTQGTITDSDGNYSLSNVPGDATLVYSFIGMKTQETTVAGKSTIQIQMIEDSIGLEEVVAIGYGTRRKKDITTSISTVDSKEISKLVPSTPELLMQGKMSGVQIIGNQGNPNARPTVRIRGTNTWGISDPLYVIDGIPIKEYGAGIEGISDQYVRGQMNVMAMIDPNDIESISVLKDASSAAIYGVRAANGVVLITTKKGRKEKPTVNYSQRFGIMNVPNKLDLLNTQEFVQFNNDLYATDPASENSRSPLNDVFRPGDPSYLGDSPTYDWQGTVLNENALTQDYAVNLSGGTEKADYYISFGYSDQEGIYIGKQMDRYSGSVKLNVQVNDYAKVGINYRLSTATGLDRAFNSSLINVSMTPPWQPIYDPDGINGYAPVLSGYDENGNWRGTVLYGNGTRYNVPGYFSMMYGNNSSLRNMGNAYVEIKPLKDLTLKGTINIDHFDNKIYGGSQYLSTYFKYDGTNPTAKGGPGSVGDYERRITKNHNVVYELTANYDKVFKKHTINLLFNAMGQHFDVDYMRAATDYLTTTNIDLIGLGGDRQYTVAGSFKNRGALQGFLFRSGYNYDSKYYLDFTIRRDGSARFAPENRWGTFPGVSAAWRISKENFMAGQTWITDLKFRAGWGQLGNQEVRDMAFLSAINTAPVYAWGNNPNNVGYGYTSQGAAVYGMANRDLSWEKTSTINIGFDAVLLDKIDFSAEYYNKLTDGILQTVTLPQSVGVISKPVDNVASVRNSGFEVSANYREKIGDLTFSIGGNFTTVNNVVEELYGGIPMWNIEEGYSLNYIKGYKVGGIFQSDAEAQAWMQEYDDVAYQKAKVTAGDFYFEDLRGAPTPEDIEQGINQYYSPDPDGIIDNYDQVYLGKTIPGFYYGINLTANYKGFDLSAQFTGVGDIQKVNQARSTLGGLNTEGFNRIREVLDHWTPDNTDTNIPRQIWGDPAGNGRFSNFYVDDADYLRLANLQLGYTLPKAVYVLTNNILRDARIYVGCSNLFTITKFDGLDPEDEYNPAPVIIYTGLNIQF